MEVITKLVTYASSRLLPALAVICAAGYAMSLTPPAVADPAVAAAARQELPDYVPAQIPTGALTSVGSDSMDDLVRLWVEEYKKYQPGISLSVVGHGSASAPSALIEGKADLGPMARPMKTLEREEFISKYGFEPTQIRTGLAAVGIYVSEENPLNSISIPELKRIFADESEGNGRRQAPQWGELIGSPAKQAKSKIGLQGKSAFDTLSAVALGRPTGTYLNAYFRQRVLLPADYAPWVLSTGSAKSMFEAINMNSGTIALGEMTTPPAGVKLLAVSANQTSDGRNNGTTAVKPELPAIISGEYPLSRYLNIYIVRDPGEALDPALMDFLKFVLSKQGQKLVEAEGMIPLPANIAKEELAKLQ